MPIIQQERGARSIKGLPVRWGVRAYRELTSAMGDPLLPQPEAYTSLAALLDVVTSAPIPPDATDAQLCILAEKYAASCVNAAAWARNHPWPWLTEAGAVRARMLVMCKAYSVEAPDNDDDEQDNKRCQDARWWRKQVRTLHARTFEAAAIRLGWVSSRTGAYASDETVKRRLDQVRRNRAALKSVTMKNEDTGQTFTLDQLADKGTSNKRIRRGELMLRLAGCEDVAIKARHAGVFVTMTNPSAYHAMLEKSGQRNPKFNGATPRESHQNLQGNWEKIRAELGRHGIAPYGFRIAEPHHDGCAHWHILLFLPAYQVRRMQRIIAAYALQQDGDEPGAARHRVTFERMKSERGSAAGYLIKYISKNIDVGDNMDGHDQVNGEKLLIPDNGAARLAQRVDAWAGVWGIRQFQPIGQPPVTVWREIRRIEREAVEDAPKNIFDAWHAAQRETDTDMETGEVTVTKPANFGIYIMAQGGVNQGRDYLIRLSKVDAVIEGRYGLVNGEVTTGIYCSKSPEIEYLSKRYTWTRGGGGAVFDVPRSSVNNCTDDAPGFWGNAAPAPAPMAPHDDSDWWGQADFAVFEDRDYLDLVVDQDERWRIIAALKKCDQHENIMRFQQ